MKNCSVAENLQIVPGCLEDYKRLSHFHYRGGRPGPVSAIFTIIHVNYKAPVGVVVYSNTSPGLTMRNIATSNIFVGLDRNTQLSLNNVNIRRISRLIIEPRFRGIGLASRLIRKTMPLLNVPIIEALAVMGWVNPFLERAGMKAYKAPPSVVAVQFLEALSIIGISQAELIDPEQVQHKLDELDDRQEQFIENQIRHFLKSHGRRREMLPGIERTRYILSKLTTRPVYYIWFNPKLTKEEQSCEKLKLKVE